MIRNVNICLRLHLSASQGASTREGTPLLGPRSSLTRCSWTLLSLAVIVERIVIIWMKKINNFQLFVHLLLHLAYHAWPLHCDVSHLDLRQPEDNCNLISIIPLHIFYFQEIQR